MPHASITTKKKLTLVHRLVIAGVLPPKTKDNLSAKERQQKRSNCPINKFKHESEL